MKILLDTNLSKEKNIDKIWESGNTPCLCPVSYFDKGNGDISNRVRTFNSKGAELVYFTTVEDDKEYLKMAVLTHIVNNLMIFVYQHRVILKEEKFKYEAEAEEWIRFFKSLLVSPKIHSEELDEKLDELERSIRKLLENPIQEFPKIDDPDLYLEEIFKFSKCKFISKFSEYKYIFEYLDTKQYYHTIFAAAMTLYDGLYMMGLKKGEKAKNIKNAWNCNIDNLMVPYSGIRGDGIFVTDDLFLREKINYFRNIDPDLVPLAIPSEELDKHLKPST